MQGGGGEEKLDQLRENWSGEKLGEHVGELRLGRDLNEGDGAVGDLVA